MKHLNIEYSFNPFRKSIMEDATIHCKKLAARKRWKMLGEVLRGTTTDDLASSNISVRRFQSYGLLTTQSTNNTKKDKSSDECTWFDYSSQYLPDFVMKIRHLGGAVSAKQLNGFNNTGNVCVWPSEEVMTYFCMQHLKDFKGQRVIELGGGMTCLAGVALGLYSEAEHIELTDGNEESVNNLEKIINCNEFKDTTVGARLVRWGETELGDDLKAQFDTVICADCLFFDEGREDLNQLLHDLLKPGGKVLMFAPSRNKTFYIFADIASKYFKVDINEQYDNRVWQLHSKFMEQDPESYDPALHFPIMMTLTPLSRDSTPESR